MVDALSRRSATCSLMEISTDWKSHLLVEYSKNNFTCEVMDGKIHDDRYRVINDVLFYKDRVYLMQDSGIKKKILTAVHDSPLVGHQGFFKTYRQIRERFSWKGLKQDVMRHISEYDLPAEQVRACSCNKDTSTTPHSKDEMGEYIDGLHHKPTQGPG
jgi:hypothetical protein